MAIGKDKDDEDQFDGIAEGADAAAGKNQDDEVLQDGVAEGIDNSDVEDAAKQRDDSKARGFAKGQTDKTKQGDADEDPSFGKKRRGYKK